MQIIPSIDILQGKCVRLTEGRFSRRREYAVTPRAMAEQFLRFDVQNLHVVDLDGAKAGRVVNWSSIEEILSLGEMKVQVGGGVRTEEDLGRLIALGVAHVVIGTAAIRTADRVETWAKLFGTQKLCVAVDIRSGFLASDAWQTLTGVNLVTVVRRMADIGITRFLSTDVRRDGTLSGPNVELYRKLVESFPTVEWIASGGVSSIDDVLVLKQTGVAGVIIGRALHEGILSLQDLIGTLC